jgi:sporulation protein YlmC with PRC-barrel domain
MREVTLEKKYLTRDKIIGKQVIDSKATIMGTVKDLSFDLVAKDFSLLIKAKTDKEITVDSKNVKVVGDVILLTVAAETFETPVASATPTTPKASPSVTPPAKPSPPRTPGLCSGCGFQNESTSKFCIKCGSKI